MGTENFEFPANIKQVGSINGGAKIYIEDYVCSYLHNYAGKGGYSERIAFLVGRGIQIDGERVLFISGAVAACDAVTDKGILRFSAASFEHAREQIAKYFDNLEIVGWMQSQPGYGIGLNAAYAAYHLEAFKSPHQVMFVIDPIEKLNAFYYRGEQAKKPFLAEARGYFIYYDKNDGMHEYMIENKGGEEPLEAGEGAESVDMAKMGKIRKAVSKPRPPAPRFPRRAAPFRQAAFSGNAPKTAVASMFSTLSAFLALVCVVMGAGLARNENKIRALEGSLSELNTSYKNLLLSGSGGAGTKTVFAEEEISQVETVEPSIINEESGFEDMPEEKAPPQPPAEPEKTKPEPEPEPEKEPEVSETSGPGHNPVPETYTVMDGDNLSYISMTFYGTQSMVSKIMEVNEIKNPDTIYAGKVLKLPRP
ncbi:MAG: LysM domain-containing protein [Clostridiales bacterium]|jgi:nucleoid-associated protein YgaU|nr:LysM domain-containing protein [Clostridiales bacterium]